jgi:murein L,D-transpeptidase YcbB/YkuD
MLASTHLTKHIFPATAIVLLLICLAFAFGCRNVTGYSNTTTDHAKKVNRTDEHIFSMPVDSLDSSYYGLAIKPLRTFYLRRENKLYWTSKRGCSDAADSLITFIEKIRYYGLHSHDYHLDEIRQLQGKLALGKNVYRIEALLTDAYITMARHTRFGKLSCASHQTDSLGIALLEKSSQQGGPIQCIINQQPEMLGYQQLKQGLKQLLDSLPYDQINAVFADSQLASYSVNKKLQIIEINLARWRWERSFSGKRYIIVNIPAFMLYVVDSDSIMLESKVIVGTPEKPTPILSSVIECFITYPYWHVPRKIAIEEYLPILKKDISFLTRNNFDVLDRKENKLNPDSIQWNKFTSDYFPVVLRQREGVENSLGIIKFVFDNPFAVYLHDTNAKYLFKSNVRAFSHGCIRMEHAVELAHYLAAGKPGDESPLVNHYIKEKERHSVEVKNPIPIYTRYFTCEFKNNVLIIYDDIYLKDTALYKLLVNGVSF